MKGAVLCYIAARVTPPGLMQEGMYLAAILCVVFGLVDAYVKTTDQK